MVVFSAPVFAAIGPTLLTGSGFMPMCNMTPTPALLAVPIVKRTCDVALVWQLIFHKLFSRFAPHLWRLVLVQAKPSGRWQNFVDSAKVRFACKNQNCGHGWTSMKGRIAFWCSFSNNFGIVAYRLYGQQCDSCQGDTYEPAMWYPEEIEKVLLNIYNRVAHAFYGLERPPIQLNRRPGKPKNPHNSDKCQACKDGVCAERR